MSMRPISLRTGFFAFTFVAIASTTGGLLTACSTGAQNQSQVPSAPATDTSVTNDMGHGSSMDHSMAMDLGPADTNYDLRFIDALTVHHQSAVEGAQDALQKSQRSEIKQIAQEIIDTQRREIEQLQQWREQWYPNVSAQPRQDTKPDLGAADDEYDLRFINYFTGHHGGALDIARDALQKSQRPEIRQLSQDVIKAQTKEINQLKQWRKQWYQH